MADPHMSLFLAEEEEFAWTLYDPQVRRLLLEGGQLFQSKLGPFILTRTGKPVFSTQVIEALRQRTMRRTKSHCEYCSTIVGPANGPSVQEGRVRAATLDHRVPLSRGGTWKLSNLACACEPCNRRKSDATEAEYRHMQEVHGDDAMRHLKAAHKARQSARSKPTCQPS